MMQTSDGSLLVQEFRAYFETCLVVLGRVTASQTSVGLRDHAVPYSQAFDLVPDCSLDSSPDYDNVLERWAEALYCGTRVVFPALE